MVLNEQQLDEFEQRGVILLERALDEAELSPLRAQLQDWVDESRQHDGPFGAMLDGRPRFDVEPGHSAARPALRRVASPEEVSPVFRDLLYRGPLLDAAADLLGGDVRFHHAKLNCKLPGSGTRVAWHQDFPFDPLSNDDSITVMLYLDDVDGDLGPPRVVPGSHRGPLYSLRQNGIFTGAVDAAVAADCERAALECVGPAGTLCLMHTRCLHASSANRAQRARTLFIASLYAADAVPLAPVAVPSRLHGQLLRGRDRGRVRAVPLQVEMPEVPEGASFFAQQAKQGNA
ncbi:MAG: phytanoyl-CoA dioxygenase family protein [Gammaproteobacteria bacterium]|nr:phytanoyl-CoA dioxygenase family protein [Gammaproteobacteria bacterium]